MRNRTLAAGASFAMAIAIASPAHAQFYKQQNLVSDGAVEAKLTDPDLVNAWGLTASATSPWWVADNGTGKSTLYNGNTGAKVALTVSVQGAPTGIVFNPTSGFAIPLHGTARFIFASEDGTISAWSGGTQAFVVVDNSASGAVYKGLAIVISLRHELPRGHRGCVRLDIRARHARGRIPRCDDSERLCAVRHTEHRGHHLRHLRAAGRGRT